MSTNPVRNLLLGALLLVAAWVPAATMAAPHAATAASPGVHAPARNRAPVRQVKAVAQRACEGVREQRS